MAPYNLVLQLHLHPEEVLGRVMFGCEILKSGKALVKLSFVLYRQSYFSLSWLWDSVWGSNAMVWKLKQWMLSFLSVWEVYLLRGWKYDRSQEHKSVCTGWILHISSRKLQNKDKPKELSILWVENLLQAKYLEWKRVKFWNKWKAV